MAYAGDVPWHGLGVKVSSDLTPEEMLKAADLDWATEKRPLHLPSGKILTDSFALVRPTDEEVFSIVGKGYTPTTNLEAFTFFKKFVDAGHAKMETAGSLKKGKHVWGLAKFDNSFELAGGDHIQSNLLVSVPHVLGIALQIQFTPIRVVCWNTLTQALRGANAKGVFRMPHVKAMDAEIKNRAEVALGLATEQMTEFRTQAQLLSDKRAVEELRVDFFCSVFKAKDTEHRQAKDHKLVRQAVNALEFAPGAQLRSADNSWWGAFNAVTYVVDHQMGQTRDNALHNAWFGYASGWKRHALKKAMEMAVDSPDLH